MVENKNCLPNSVLSLVTWKDRTQSFGPAEVYDVQRKPNKEINIMTGEISFGEKIVAEVAAVVGPDQKKNIRSYAIIGKPVKRVIRHFEGVRKEDF